MLCEDRSKITQSLIQDSHTALLGLAGDPRLLLLLVYGLILSSLYLRGGAGHAEMLARYLKAVSPIYCVAGPQDMVKGVHSTINEAGVDDDDIRVEEFAGY